MIATIRLSRDGSIEIRLRWGTPRWLDGDEALVDRERLTPAERGSAG